MPARVHVDPTAKATPTTRYTVVTSCLASAAFLLCLACEFGCHEISFASTDGFREPVDVAFGIWKYQRWTRVAASGGQGSVIYETCDSYPKEVEVDGYWMAARAFSILSSIVGGIFLFYNLFTACIYPSRSTPKIEAPAFLLASLSQGLSLLLLRSNLCRDNAFLREIQSDMIAAGNAGLAFPETCSMASGAGCSIAATVFWFLAATVSLVAIFAERKGGGGGGTRVSPVPGEDPWALG